MTSWLLGVGIPLLYLLGVASALDAVMKARTAQGAAAWAISHVTVPFLSLPLYWVFGRSTFDDYVRVLQELATAVEHRLEEAKAALQLAALRGVDVRILIPGMADHWMFRYVHDAFLPEVDQAFCEDVAEMLERDFSRSTPVEASDIGELGIRSRLATEVTRLLAPTL